MAIRIDAVGDYLERQTVPAPYTTGGLAYLTTDRNDYSTILGVDNGAVGGSAFSASLQTDSDGTTLGMWNGSAFVGSRTLTTSAWFFWALSVASNGTTFNWFHANLGDASLYTAGGTISTNTNNMRHHIGNNSFNEWWNGRFANVFIFNAQLTAAEIEALRHQQVPSIATAPYLWSPMQPGATERLLDYSGNSRTWTAGGTLTDEDGPPVTWRVPIWAIGIDVGGGGGGTQYNQSASGTLTSAGTIIKHTTKTFAGTMTSAGVIIKSTAKALAGTLTSAGTIIKSTAKTFAGTLTPSGALATAMIFVRAFTGTLTSAGALTKQAAKSFTGTLVSAGSLVKQTSKALAGALTPSGALATVRAFLLSIGGTLTTAGTLTKSTAKSFVGTLTSAGNAIKSTSKALTGTLTSAGAVTMARGFVRAFTGVLDFAGDVAGVLNGGSQQFFQDVGGTLTSAGALVKHTTKTFAGILTSDGALAKLTAKLFAGTLTPSGALTTLRAFLVSLGGTLTSAGTLVKGTAKNVEGALSPTGAISKAISRALGGALSFLGTLLGVLQGFIIPHLDVDISDAAVYTVTLADSAVYSIACTDSSVYQVMISDTSRS